MAALWLMDWDQFTFVELHLLPRVIFAIGAALRRSYPRPNPVLGIRWPGLVFVAFVVLAYWEREPSDGVSGLLDFGAIAGEGLGSACLAASGCAGTASGSAVTSNGGPSACAFASTLTWPSIQPSKKAEAIATNGQ
jgi:hypothetical protein